MLQKILGVIGVSVFCLGIGVAFTPQAEAQQSVPTLSLSVDHPTINPFDWATPTITTNGYRCLLEGGIAGSGWDDIWWTRLEQVRSVQPLFTTTYSVECFTLSGLSSGKKSITITVNDGLHLLTSWASPASVDSHIDHQATIFWKTSSDAVSCIAGGGASVGNWPSGTLPTNGSRTVSIPENFNGENFGIECFDANGVSTGNRGVYVRAAFREQVHICPDSVALFQSASQTLKAYYNNSIAFTDCHNPNGIEVTGLGTWSSTNQQIAVITDGAVRGVANGTARVQLNYLGIAGGVMVTVSGFSAPPTSLPPRSSVCTTPGATCETNSTVCPDGMTPGESCNSGLGICCVASSRIPPQSLPPNFRGVIANAPPLTASLTKVLNFLLWILGSLGILGLLVAGILYFTAHGDERQVRTAKKAVVAGIVGITLALSSMVVVWTIAKLLS